MVDPQVSVEVVGFRSMYVLGEVRMPGKYEYVPNLTVMQAVAMAGGYTYRANEGKAEITRHVKGALNTFTVDNKTMLKPGDTILIKRRWF
jgi:polysaccharide export outer membrane protein